MVLLKSFIWHFLIYWTNVDKNCLHLLFCFDRIFNIYLGCSYIFAVEIIADVPSEFGILIKLKGWSVYYMFNSFQFKFSNTMCGFFFDIICSVYKISGYYESLNIVKRTRRDIYELYSFKWKRAWKVLGVLFNTR